MKPEYSCVFPKSRRLSSKKEIDSLFSEGHTFSSGPFRVFYRLCQSNNSGLPECRIAVAVPKKHLKSAVKRNLVKRRIKESFRLLYPHKLEPTLIQTRSRLLFLCLYLPYDIKPWHVTEEKMGILLSQFSELCKENAGLTTHPVG